jgi:hypothetical protein
MYTSAKRRMIFAPVLIFIVFISVVDKDFVTKRIVSFLPSYLIFIFKAYHLGLLSLIFHVSIYFTTSIYFCIRTYSCRALT